MSDDTLTLTVNGQVYAGWTDIRVSRSIEETASVFDISVSEKWAGRSQPWQIKPFDEAVVRIGDQTVLTGYVERYQPSYDKDSHGVCVSGRSRTCDLVDCMPEIKGGQFSGYTIDKIARALCTPFGITVVVKADVGAPLPNATLEKCETGHAFLEKLCRLRSLLVCDDADGNLVLTQAGTQSAAGALVEGENILAASAELSSNQRFQKYVVLSQAPLGYDEQNAHLDIIGAATDAGCPRYRRYAEMAETPSDTALATKRARWRALRNYGQSTRANITALGWRQDDGNLWDTNLLVPVKSPMLVIDKSLLIGQMRFTLDENGRRTELTLMPPEAYQPAPDFKTKKGKGTADLWTGLQ